MERDRHSSYLRFKCLCSKMSLRVVYIILLSVLYLVVPISSVLIWSPLRLSPEWNLLPMVHMSGSHLSGPVSHMKITILYSTLFWRSSTFAFFTNFGRSTKLLLLKLIFYFLLHLPGFRPHESCFVKSFRITYSSSSKINRYTVFTHLPIRIFLLLTSLASYNMFYSNCSS